MRPQVTLPISHTQRDSQPRRAPLSGALRPASYDAGDSSGVPSAHPDHLVAK